MGVVDLVFPKYCLECRKAEGYICSSCLQKVKRAREVCYQCGQLSLRGKTHLICKEAYGLDGVYSIWKYQGVIRKAILGLKYKFASEIAKELATAVIKEINPNPYLLNAALVPIPLHKSRARWRGFNQSAEIGKILAQEFGWGYVPKMLMRIKKTSSQARIKDEKKRKDNVHKAFLFNEKYQPLTKNSQPIIVFDDVWTTGATTKQAARELKMSGENEVWGLTLAS